MTCQTHIQTAARKPKMDHNDLVMHALASGNNFPHPAFAVWTVLG
jgi:hypothetical protein